MTPFEADCVDPNARVDNNSLRMNAEQVLGIDAPTLDLLLNFLRRAAARGNNRPTYATPKELAAFGDKLKLIFPCGQDSTPNSLGRRIESNLGLSFYNRGFVYDNLQRKHITRRVRPCIWVVDLKSRKIG